MSKGRMSERLEPALVALRQILRATDLSSRALAKKCGLNPSQLILMQLVANQPGDGLTPGKLAQEMSLSQATVTTLIDKLTARGLLERSRDAGDKRRFFIRLTEAGKTMLDVAPDSLQERFSRGFAGLEDWEQAFILAALERTVGLLKAEDIDAAPVLDTGSIQSIEA